MSLTIDTAENSEQYKRKSSETVSEYIHRVSGLLQAEATQQEESTQMRILDTINEYTTHDGGSHISHYGESKAMRKLHTLLDRCGDTLVAMAKERAASIGHEQYAEAIYTKTSSQLHTDIMEELADAIVYASVMLEKADA